MTAPIETEDRLRELTKLAFREVVDARRRDGRLPSARRGVAPLFVAVLLALTIGLGAAFATLVAHRSLHLGNTPAVVPSPGITPPPVGPTVSPSTVPPVTALLGDGVAVDPSGDIFIGDLVRQGVMKVTPSHTALPFAGQAPAGSTPADRGPAATALLGNPLDVALGPEGAVYVLDARGVLRITPDGIATRLAVFAVPGTPSQIAVTATGVYVACGSCRPAGSLPSGGVYKIAGDGTVTAIVGTGGQGFGGDGGPAANARVNAPVGVAVDPSGNVYFSEPGNNRIRRIAPSGVITTVAGNGTLGFAGDGGPATQAELGQPGKLAVDASGDLFILDYLNNRIREVTPDGVIRTAAGNGVAGHTADGGPATGARIQLTPVGPGGPFVSIATDKSNALYILEAGVGHVRRVSPTGVITTIL